MKKTLQLAALSLLTLMLLTCRPLAPKEREEIKMPEVHVGTQGVEVEWLENAPPSELYENSYFELGFFLHNAGATDIRNGIASLSLDENLIAIAEPKKTFRLKGKSVYNPEGEKRLLSFPARTRLLEEDMLQSYETMLLMNLCYSYSTIATLIVCIDTDPKGLMGKTKVCTPSAQSFGEGQGGPVIITKIEKPVIVPHEEPRTVLPKMIFYVDNRGQGRVLDRARYAEACAARPLPPEAWGKIDFTVYLSDQRLRCYPERIKLEGEQKIECQLEVGIPQELGSYLAPLRVELDYGYVSSTSRSLTILRKS